MKQGLNLEFALLFKLWRIICRTVSKAFTSLFPKKPQGELHRRDEQLVTWLIYMETLQLFKEFPVYHSTAERVEESSLKRGLGDGQMMFSGSKHLPLF